MADCERLPINEVQQSKQHTIDIDKDTPSPPSLNIHPSNLSLKLSIIKRMYEAKKLSAKKAILLQWPNQQMVKVIQKSELISLRNNGYYIGEIANNVIHGRGIAIYSLDRFYQGQFQNNYKHGKGIESLPTGLYEGSYVNNKPEGKGVFESEHGDKYSGQFRAGMKHGKGIWMSTKHSYEGDWKGNKPNGIGRIKNKQSEYEGMVVDGLKHGQGKEVFANGDVYTGEYYNGRPQGFGLYVWNKSRATYKGEFKNGLRHGKGVWTQQGDTYSGLFSNDKKNGMGHLRWASGNQYEGMFFEDIMHGEGFMKWTDGSWYRGNWLYGVQNGYGEIQQVGEQLKKGIFENNVLVLHEDFSSHAISKKIKLQRLNKKDKQVEKDKNIDKEKGKNPPKAKYAHHLQQFQTQSQYSKKILPSYNSSLAFRSSKPHLRRRVKTLKSQQMKSTSLDPREHPHSKTKSFSEGEQMRLIDWRKMRVLKPS